MESSGPELVVAPSWTVALDGWLEEHVADLVAVRRQLHAHPELAYAEHATTELVFERLTLAGLEPRVPGVGTGVVCDIVPAPDGPQRGGWAGTSATALRADIDALPMADQKDVPYRSQTPGVAHACGHDVHTAVVLGAGLFLARHRELLPRPVRLLFQPAEEVMPGGALALIDDGALEGVDRVLGLHCEPKLDTGRIGLRTGAITSASDAVEIVLTGPGGHTARPGETVDLIKVAAELARRLPTDARTAVAEVGPTVIVFGALHAGDAANVIPTSAVLRGTVRTPSLEVWERIEEVVRQVVADVVGPLGAGYEVRYQRGVPPVVNDAAVIEHLEGVARQLLGPEAVAPAAQSLGGDDFAHLTRRAPGAYVRLGVHRPGDAPCLDLHAGHFDVDESAIAVGVRLLVGAVVNATEA